MARKHVCGNFDVFSIMMLMAGFGKVSNFHHAFSKDKVGIGC